MQFVLILFAILHLRMKLYKIIVSKAGHSEMSSGKKKKVKILAIEQHFPWTTWQICVISQHVGICTVPRLRDEKE